ncbi:tyrosine-type recombinase/integrase [Aeromonas bestiarum]|jgi:integrase|uniref:tyrosine-type recombinase/integrase n=1 Tax=Aeromonas bestiarum TaxID=105751 RepID=UPI0032B1D690
MPTKRLDKNDIMLVQIDQHPQFAYDPYPISQSGQLLDLTQSKIILEPEREAIFFDKIPHQLREHVRAWISYASHVYSNYALFSYYTCWRLLTISDGITAEDIAETIQEIYRELMSSERSASTKSTLRMIYKWCVEEGLPHFDEDFYDYYLASIKFGTDEGKGLDVIMEIPDRGPLTIKEERIFISTLNSISPETLTTHELQGLVSLKCAQVLGIRNIQVMRLKFSDLQISDKGVYTLKVLRAKQRGRANNDVYKIRPITKTLAKLLSLMKARYEEILGTTINDNWPVISDYYSVKDKLINRQVRITTIWYITNQFRVVAGLDFKVTNRRLRKTFCSRLIAKGTPMSVVAELMDHSDLQQLDVYYRQSHTVAKKLDDVLRSEAMDIIDAFAGKVVTPDNASQRGQGIFAPSKNLNLVQIGSCGSATPCSLQPPLSCYNCSSLEAFEDVDHKAIVDTMVAEVQTAFGDAHAINILQHKNFLAARKFADMFDRGEL